MQLREVEFPALIPIFSTRLGLRLYVNSTKSTKNHKNVKLITTLQNIIQTVDNKNK